MEKRDGTRRIEKLFNFRPVLFAALFLCLGILFYFFYHFCGISALWLLCLLPLAGLPFFFCRTREKAWKTACAVALLGCFFFLGFFSFSLQTGTFFDCDRWLGEQYVTGYVVEKREYGSRTAVVLDGLRIGKERVSGKLIAYLPPSDGENIGLCDELFLHGKLGVTTVTAENFSLTAKSFGDGVRLRTWTGDVYVTGKRFDLFLFLRLRVEEAIDKGMDETPAAVTKAVLFGNTDGIDEGLYENIRRGGIAHIFAVSGLHVGVLYGFCLTLLKRKPFEKLPKLGRFALLFALLFGYAGVCGFSASVVRATVICLTSYASSLLSVRKDFLESLGLALMIVLLPTPSALFEVGCQLSFAACFGIAFLSKPIGQVFDELQKLYRKRFPRQLTREQRKLIKKGDTLPLSVGERAYRAVASFLSASLSAQIFTAPLMLQAFGYVSGWGMFLNCLFIPLVSALFSALLLLVVLACLLPIGFASVILYLPNAVWSLLLLLFQTLDFSSFAVQGLTLSAGALVAYYFGWIFCTDKFNLKKSFSYALVGVCFLAFAITMVALNV